jgi:hypothetical protein
VNSTLEYAESLGLKPIVFKTPENPAFEGLVIFENKNEPKEKTVRVYRGVNNIDANIFNQTCYALRGIDQNTEAGKEVKSAVKMLLQNPTYENFLKYKELASPLLDDFGKRYLEDFDKLSQKYILDGSSFAHFLHWETFNHSGTVSMFLPSPYLSVSHSLLESFGYIRGHGAVLVLDIPISNLHSNTGCTENTVDLEIKLEYIKGFIIKRAKILSQFKNLREEVVTVKKAIDSIFGETDINKNSNNFTPDEEKTEKAKRQEEIEKRNEYLKAEDKKFLEAKLKKELYQNFLEVFGNIKFEDLEILTYKELIQNVFDFYQNEFSNLFKNGYGLTDDFNIDLKNIDIEKLKEIRKSYLLRKERVERRSREGLFEKAKESQ